NQQVNSVTPSYETCGGPHSDYECNSVSGYTQDVYATTGNYNSGETITDQVLTENTIRVPPPVFQSPPAPASSEIPLPLISSEPLKQNSHQPPIPYPSRLNKEKLQDKADVHKFF
nr:hypothetical protein [Tanacetum cinerariifolium]